MKFWEMISILRNEQKELETILNDPIWSRYLRWYQKLSLHIQNQNRTILDAEVPIELCQKALSLSKHSFYLHKGYLYRSSETISTDSSRNVLSAFDVYSRFGASCIEEVLEKDSCRVVGLNKLNS